MLFLGQERIEMAMECISTSNGSAHDYVNKIISQQVLAGEDLPQAVSHDKLKNICRSAVSEFMNKDMVSTCWITNLLDVIDTLKISVGGDKIKGFVQRFDASYLFYSK
jgi:hypothetical protein